MLFLLLLPTLLIFFSYPNLAFGAKIIEIVTVDAQIVDFVTFGAKIIEFVESHADAFKRSVAQFATE